MKFDKPEDDYRAGLERIEQARFLYQQGVSYALSMYVAGVSVECMLRAFKRLHTPTFDERHDLLLLFAASGMLKVRGSELREKGLSEAEAIRFVIERRAAVNDVYNLWSNAFRHASEEWMRAYLKSRNQHRGIRGDYLKANALKSLNSARKFIDMGVQQWPVRERRRHPS